MITLPKIDVNITTLTPIWTGNRERKMDGVKETGILGSLRWWYEAILRGFDCYVCDPTAESKCSYNTDLVNGTKAQNGTGVASDGFFKDKEHTQICVCPACQIFGCTGWGKQFRMRWDDDNGQAFHLENPDGGRDDPTYRHKPNGGQGYYICSRESGKTGGKCRAIFYPQNQRVGEILTYLLKLASRWGGFGARPQVGYGICDTIISASYLPKIDKPTILSATSKADERPDLRDFFFCEFTPKFTPPTPSKTSNYNIDGLNYFTIETKYRIREALRLTPGVFPDIRHFICGIVQKSDRAEEKISSKIFISRPLNGGIMRIRGYVPQESELPDYDRGVILHAILAALGISNALQFARNHDNYNQWLKSLIE